MVQALFYGARSNHPRSPEPASDFMVHSAIGKTLLRIFQVLLTAGAPVNCQHNPKRKMDNKIK